MSTLKRNVDTAGAAAIGQLTLQREDGGRYRITKGAAEATCTEPGAVAAWARFDDRGRYRPLTGALTLPGGLDVLCDDWETAARVIDDVYPLALTHEAQYLDGTLRVVSLDEVLDRQSGRYEKARMLDEPGRALVREVLCSRCARTPVWAGEAPGYGEIPCPEPCSVFVAFVREAVIWDEEQVEPAEPDPDVPYAAFETPGNELRETYRRLRRQTGADE